MRIRNLLCLALLAACVGAAAPAAGQSDIPTFPEPAAADTLRTNLWLAQALIADLVRETVAALPPPPSAVVLLPDGNGPDFDLFSTVLTGILLDEGYRLYLDPSVKPDTTGTFASDPLPNEAYLYEFQVESLSLDYPRIGRRFGIWRQWVDRELTLAALVTISHRSSGRLLLNDRLERSFSDRVPSDDFDSVRSDAYGFTDGQLQESGWNRRFEEIVVLGTLAGLIAVYFANTSE